MRIKTSADASDQPTTWEGFVYYLENPFGMQAGDRGFNDFLYRRFTNNALHCGAVQARSSVLLGSTRLAACGLSPAHSQRRLLDLSCGVR